MIGALSLWSQRRKLRGSIGRDPLSPGDPGPWLDGAGTVLHLRTSCPEPAWLAHCAYWAGVKMDAILIGALGAGEVMRTEGVQELTGLPSMFELKQLTYPELAEVVVAVEGRHPEIRGIEQVVPSQLNSTMGFHLGAHADRSWRGLGGEPLSPDAALAGGVVLMVASVFHRARGLKESLVLTAGAMATLFARARPGCRGPILDAQRIAYHWQTSMTSTEFMK